MFMQCRPESPTFRAVRSSRFRLNGSVWPIRGRLKPMKYERLSFETVRKLERQRLRELEAVGAELNAGAHIRQAYEDGVDPETFRATHEARQRREVEQRVALAANPIPEAERLTGPAAVVGVLVSAGRRDLAELHCDRHELTRDVRRRALRSMAPRELFGSILGTRYGSAYDVGAMMVDVLDDADRAQFGGDLAAIGLLPASALGAAVRDGMQAILTDAWDRSGQFWRAACRIVPLPTFRAHRLWVNRSAAVQAEPIPETLPPRLDMAGAESWPQVDVEIKERASKLVLSRKRATNGGFSELAAHIGAAVATWHDLIDGLVADALDGSPEVSGTIDMGVLASAITAVNLQEIGGLPLGSDGGMATVLAGEGVRRDVLAAKYGSPSAEGDRQALIREVVFSATVDGAKAYLRHGRFTPVVLAVLESDGAAFMPAVAYGASAAVRDAAGDAARLSVSVRADFADPKLLQVPGTGAGRGRGAVRLTIS